MAPKSLISLKTLFFQVNKNFNRYFLRNVKCLLRYDKARPLGFI